MSIFKLYNLIYNYNMCVRSCVRASDGTIPRFNGPAESARTVGFQKREPAWTVGFQKRKPRSWWLMRRVVREDQETKISRRVSAATEQIRPRDRNLEASFRYYWTNPTMIFWLIFLVVVTLRITESCKNWRENYSHDQRITAETPKNQSHLWRN
jgi:hypothetical protein